MKLGTARRRAAAESRNGDRSFPVPPGYRCLERIEDETANPMRTPGRTTAPVSWRAEAPGGFQVMLTVVRGGPGGGALRELVDGLATARHPNLIPVFGCWPFEEGLVLVSELAEMSVWDRFRAATDEGATGIPVSELLDYLAEAAKALDYLGAHARFQGHGGIRPETLRIVGGGVKVSLPALVDEWKVGFPARDDRALRYLAPERVWGAGVSARADQFSLALVYCYLRTGRHPFADLDLAGPEGLPLALSGDQRRLDLTHLPAAERSAVARALADDPERRWPSCRAFVEAVAADVRDTAHGALAPPPVEGRPAHSGPPRRVAGLLVGRSGNGIGQALRGARLEAGRGGVVGTVGEPPSGELALPAAAAATGPVKTRDKALRDRPAGLRDGATATDVLRSEADQLLRRGRYGEAIVAYTSVLSAEPLDASSLHGRGLARLAREDIEGALADLDMAAAYRPHDTSVRNNRGLARLARGDVAGALNDFQAASRLDPGFAVVRYNLGRALAISGEAGQAVHEYDAAIRLAPGFAKAYKARGDARTRLGDRVGAMTDYDEAIRLRPGDDAALNNRGLLHLALGAPARALDDFEAAARGNPHDAMILFNRAKALARLGRHAAATAAFDEALRRDPALERALQARARQVQTASAPTSARADSVPLPAQPDRLDPAPVFATVESTLPLE